MRHDAKWCGQHHVPELTRWQQVRHKLLNPINSHVEPWRNHTALVDPANQVNHNLASTVIIHNFQISNVSILLHALQEFDDHFGVGPEHDLAFTALLCVADGVEGISQNADSHHGSSSNSPCDTFGVPFKPQFQP